MDNEFVIECTCRNVDSEVVFSFMQPNGKMKDVTFKEYNKSIETGESLGEIKDGSAIIHHTIDTDSVNLQIGFEAN